VAKAAIRRTLSRLRAEVERQAATPTGVDPSAYSQDPVGYANNVLRVSLTPDQQAILRALLEPPHKVLVDSGHNCGKTYCSAVAVNWWYDSFNPGVCITTAPTERDVIDLLWAEVRMQRIRAGLPLDFIGARAPEMRTSEEHYAKGYTARLGESFQGRHRPHMLFVFDEAEGIDGTYWTTTKTMFKPELGNAWLAIGNPTTTTSQAALEEQAALRDGGWRVFHISALNHPNITRQLAGEAPEIPEAVTVAQIDQWVKGWCEPVPTGERQATDFEWRPGSGNWWRPGPIAEARILGRRPSQGVHGVWSEALWEAVIHARLDYDPRDLPEIGLDVARKGDDFSCFHVRWGPCSMHHESHNGWGTAQNVQRAKDLAAYWASRATGMRDPMAQPISPKRILIKVDDDGVGGGVTDWLRNDGFAAIPVNAACSPTRPDDYPKRRDELWFVVAEKARHGRLDLSRLPQDVLARLRQQLLAPEWKLDGAGRRQVEPKDRTKEKIGRSPDDADALHLSHAEDLHYDYPRLSGQEPPQQQRAPTPPSSLPFIGDSYPSNAARRGLFGYRGAADRDRSILDPPPPCGSSRRGFFGRR
jgi:hypothetical protein